MKHLLKFNEKSSTSPIPITDLKPMEDIDVNIPITEYIKDNLLRKGDTYYYENEDGKLKEFDVEFIDDNTMVVRGEKIVLSKEAIEPGGYYWDLRYPNEINELSIHSPGEKIPFGYDRWYETNYEGQEKGTYRDANDAFFKIINM